MEIVNQVMQGIEFIFKESAIPDNSVIINQIFPNLYVFIAHIISLIFLIILVTRLAWNPTKKYIENRTQEIQSQLDAADKARLESEKNLEISKIKLLESKSTASQIIENAHLESEQKIKKLEKETLDKVNHIEKEAMLKIKREEIDLEKRMNLEVSKLALETAEVFLSKKIDDEENKKIINNIVEDLTARITPQKEK
ncbi:MAG: hypothetical protein K2H56_04325 [Malacoplasma sp.]|nr:hypothetical protein [Malacoplasma sp.]MDE7099794.1 hypothetical protein [Malacoplasma sp.]